MKVEFEFTLNNDGSPCISFKHHNKSNALEQKVLKVFIDSIHENGIQLVKTSGFIGDGECYENYEIKPIA